MAEASPHSPLEAAVAALVSLLRATAVPGVIIGGVAASLFGRPRTTRDVDALVWLQDPAAWATLLAEAGGHGLEPRIPDAIGFARRARVLLLRHRSTGVDIDLAFGALPFEEAAIARSVTRTLGRVSVPLPPPEDLVVMKAVAHRPQDDADIAAILAAQPDLDRARVRALVQEFSEALEAPDLLTDLDALIERARSTPTARAIASRPNRARAKTPVRSAARKGSRSGGRRQ